MSSEIRTIDELNKYRGKLKTLGYDVLILNSEIAGIKGKAYIKGNLMKFELDIEGNKYFGEIETPYPRMCVNEEYIIVRNINHSRKYNCEVYVIKEKWNTLARVAYIYKLDYGIVVCCRSLECMSKTVGLFDVKNKKEYEIERIGIWLGASDFLEQELRKCTGIEIEECSNKIRFKGLEEIGHDFDNEILRIKPMSNFISLFDEIH